MQEENVDNKKENSGSVGLKKKFFGKRKNTNKYKNFGPIKAIFIGGLNGIGKNMTAFEYDGDIFIVDAGMQFPDDSMFGVDKIIPDFSYIIENKEKVKGIVLTHGHEDHIGALRDLFSELCIPIYGTKFTLALAKNKLRGDQYKADTFREVKAGDEISLGKFKVEFIAVSHSIPDGVALAIKTPEGVIVHTGDFKVDYTPIDDRVIGLTRFAELGKKGVLALLCDSTNADTEGKTMSERVVGANFDRIFRERDKQRLLVVTFASNVHRIQQAIDAAIKNKRKFAIIGKSMEDNISIAKELGYIHYPDSAQISLNELYKIAPSKVVVILTGSQGEPMSALSRMARESYKGLSIGENDCVVYSSVAIPGNEASVQRVINQICRRGAEVIYDKRFAVHVSGHAGKDDIQLMLRLVKPKYFIPVHGEYRHLSAAAALARDLGMSRKNIFVLDNGDVIDFHKKNAKRAESVAGGSVLVDGLAEAEPQNIVQGDRRRLSRDGILIVSFALGLNDNSLLSEVKLNSRGFIYLKEDTELKLKIKKKAESLITQYSEEFGAGFSMKSFKKHLLNKLADFIYTNTKRRPIILPVVIKL